MAIKINGDQQFSETLKKVYSIDNEKTPVTFVMDEQLQQIEIHLSTEMVNQSKDVFQQLLKPNKTIIGKTSRGQVWVDINDIYVIEAFGNIVETIVRQQSIQLDKKLYEYEEELAQDGFLRIGKSTLVNTSKIVSIAAAYNGKLLLYLENQQKVDVNRSYTKAFKKMLLKQGG